MTNEQLKGLRDAIDAKLNGKPWEWRCKNGSNWNAGSDRNDIHAMIDNEYDFRATPEPVCRPWSKPEDVPLNCWIRRIGTGGEMLMIFDIGDNYVNTIGPRLAWSSLEYWEYSTDRKTWHPCTVEEPA